MTDAICVTRTAVEERRAFRPGDRSEVALVDLVSCAQRLHAWTGTLDSAAFWSGGNKLGLGSSAAALTAWAGAWHAYAAATGAAIAAPTLAALVDLHRRFQGGRGSGTRRRGKPSRRRDRIPAGGARRASCWFSPASEQCRIRGYFCRSLGFDTGTARPLSGFSGRPAETGGRGAAPAAVDRGSRMRGCSGGRCRRVHDGDWRLRPRVRGSRGRNWCGDRHS